MFMTGVLCTVCGAQVYLKIKSIVKVKVMKSKILVSTERSWHKEYTCVILNPYLLLLKNYDQG